MTDVLINLKNSTRKNSGTNRKERPAQCGRRTSQITFNLISWHKRHFTEDVLIEDGGGEYGWLDYVNHFSADGRMNWRNAQRALEINDASAEQFVHYKSE